MGAPRLRLGLDLCPELPWAGKQEGTGVEACQLGPQPRVLAFTTNPSSSWSVLPPSRSLWGTPRLQIFPFRGVLLPGLAQ